MCVILIRSLMLYLLVIFAVRLMGKRQLGELQPTELVITILVSNIATLPIENIDIPLIVGVTPILALVCFEVLMSWASLKFPRLRKLISGSPKIIIRNGRIYPDMLRELRFSVDDLMMSLRTSGVFDISEVEYAIVETTGTVSVLKKAHLDTPTRQDMKISTTASAPPQAVIADGKIVPEALHSAGLSTAQIENILSAESIALADVFLMTADTGGSIFIADKYGSKPIIRRYIS